MTRPVMLLEPNMRRARALLERLTPPRHAEDRVGGI